MSRCLQTFGHYEAIARVKLTYTDYTDRYKGNGEAKRERGKLIDREIEERSILLWTDHNAFSTSKISLE